jgi:hypothetical protein
MTTRRQLVTYLALASIVATACGQAISGGSLGSVSATPDPGTTSLPSSIQRDDAMAMVRMLHEQVGRIDRIDAKLMTLEEYIGVSGPIKPHAGDPHDTSITGTTGIIGDPSKRYFWAVAVSGDVWPNLRIPVSWGYPLLTSPTPYPPYRWGIFLVEAVPARVFAIGDAGIAESWPPVFDKLPNHPPTAYVAPSATPRLTTLAAKLQQPEATSAVMGLASEVRRIDRIEAKLMTWREYLASADQGAQKPPAASDSAPVWIVAVSGEIVPQFGHGATFRWGVFTIDGTDGTITSLTARSDGPWPVFFDALPDHPPVSR